MRKRYLILLILIGYSTVSQTIYKEKHQISFSLGMGLNYVTTPSFNDFLKTDIPYTNKDSIKSFSVGVEFFGGLECEVSKKLSLKLDYSYFMRSFTYSYSFFNFEYDYNVHQPYLMGYYLIKNKNSQFKVGGGLGYHLAQMEEKTSNSTSNKYKSSGLGYRGEVVFQAKLGGRLSSYISGYVLGSSMSPLKDSNGNKFTSSFNTSDVTLSSFGAGLRFGVTINLN